ncbi:hypothetical protein L6164_010474 [Bauhinia variegata]|uniref:Uncharacterized protein n=1 Tax=Bauhinia variegata TaxID=167791 RepID=A0ACB9PMX8_BAUVA|nr:hypothetical protein L6164_010474 [Bauhinia variegata]
MAMAVKLMLSLAILVAFSSLSIEADFSFSQENHICNLTSYPSFCRTTLTPHFSGSIRDHGQFFLRQSLSSAKTFHELVSSHLKEPSTIPASTKLALQDCQQLAELNIDLLSNILQTIANIISHFQACDLQTLLSAILTNQQTCLDGINEVTPYPSIITGLLGPISDGIKLYSISLALFNRGWASVTETKPAETTITMNRKLLQESIGNDMTVSEKVVVNPDGTGNFPTINDAVAAAPNNTGTNNGYHVIYVVAGVYNEYVSIPKSKENLIIVGDGINRTVITGNRSVVDGWTTFQSATFAVVGKGFVAVNITFQNTAGAAKHQAVAVRNGADQSTFYKCSFEGYQDTLYTHSLRQFYKNCDIYGTVDFIFGNAAVVFQDCNMYPRLPLENQFNAITAQGRKDPNQNTGISIQNCNIKAASDLSDASSSAKTYLGRPWKEYSRTVYMQSFMDTLIEAEGWVEWYGDFALSTLYYAEYCNWGPGSNTSNRVTWPGYHVINAKDADDFTVAKFIQGHIWLPNTGVPFRPALQ